MATNTARVTILIDPDNKRAFEQICANQDMTSSQVIRRLIREYIDQHAALQDQRMVVE